MNKKKILITGAAGLVGQNICQHLKGNYNISLHAVDKHKYNLNVLRNLNKNLRTDFLDLSSKSSLSTLDVDYDVVVINHAQISSRMPEDFVRNNVEATENLIEYLKTHSIQNVVHISSSVVNSSADDGYSSTKKKQEKIVLAAFPNAIVLRPTLMFGPLDRKHLGWLAKFMKLSPFFPVPGDGKFIRQPLFVGDFVKVIERSVLGKVAPGIYDISGVEHIYYIDIIKKIKNITNARCLILHLNYSLFKFLLRSYAIFSSNPPFTVSQLEALVIPEVFEVSDWPKKTRVDPTKFDEALRLTFKESPFQNVKVKF